MIETPYNAHLETQIEQISKRGGAFLTVSCEEQLNTMTIGWGSFGFIWGKPIIMVAVRSSRHTYGILERSLEFSVTIPQQSEAFREALELCGSKSGRDLDKFAAAGLVAIPGKKIATPVISGAAWQYECIVVYKQEMNDLSILAPDIGDRLYHPQTNPWHTLYYGEVVASYSTQ